MKYLLITLVLSTIGSFIAAGPTAIPDETINNTTGTINVVPSTGVTPGEPNCQGNKPGAVNPKINVPCRCPPTQEALAKQVEFKTSPTTATVFPLGLDLESRIRRYEITLSALQDLKCPAASTKMKPKLDALTSLRGQPASVVDQALQGIGMNDAPRT